MGAVTRGIRNPFRNRVRTGVVVLLLAIIIGLFAVMVQGALTTREQLESLQRNVRTVIELREAGAFGTGGFGEDKPLGADDFSVGTIEQIKRIRSFAHIIKIEEYIHAPQIDPAFPNAYAMVIGLRPEAPMRAIGEVDYENAQIIAGRGLDPKDELQPVVVVGQLYAKERLGIVISRNGESARLDQPVMLNNVPVRLIGVYSTGNDFGDNHVFVPLETFRNIFRPGPKLSKIRVTVDTVANVEQVTQELKQLKGVDAVTAAEQVATARVTLGSIAAATLYGSLLLFAIGGVLVVFIMTMATRERIREIGTLKALGASNTEIVKQFVAEVVTVIALASLGAVVIAALFSFAAQSAFNIDISLGRNTLALILLGGLAFAVLGCGYPILKGVRLSPIQAMRNV